VPLAHPFAKRGQGAFAARSYRALMAGLKRIPVLHELAVVGDAESPGVPGSIAMLAIRHSFSLAKTCHIYRHLVR
jgi:hypothetical protein